MIVQGKVAIVTGGAKGIGRYVAHTFLHAGGKVAIVDNDEALLHRTVRELLFLSTDVISIKADVSRESEVSEMVERVSTRFDRIDVLVNNAGIEPQGLPGVEMIAGRFVLASGAAMDLSGRLVTCDGGYLDAAY